MIFVLCIFNIVLFAYQLVMGYSLDEDIGESPIMGIKGGFNKHDTIFNIDYRLYLCYF